MNVPDICIPWIKAQRTGYTEPVRDFLIDMKFEYNEMKNHLPIRCESILDIGCGVGGIDVLLSKKFGNPLLYLLDNSKQSEKPIYGYDKGASFYNDFSATVGMMDSNGIYQYQLIDICKGFPKIKDVDLVISLLSWGYHYPVETYLEDVKKCLNKNGMIIMDIRQNTNGLETLKTITRKVDIISTRNKSTRVCAKVEK
jgi:SAM-dependent methyltransferase